MITNANIIRIKHSDLKEKIAIMKKAQFVNDYKLEIKFDDTKIERYPTNDSSN